MLYLGIDPRARPLTVSLRAEAATSSWPARRPPSRTASAPFSTI
jgi:hypothetical protein